LQGKGYRVIPVNPANAGQILLGEKVYASLTDIEERVDMVDVFRPASEAPAIVDQAIAIGAPVVWLQLGLRNDEAAAKAEAAGIEMIMNRCPKIEFGRLGGELSWSGVNSGIIQNRAPQAPRPRRMRERPAASHNLTYGIETRAIHAGAAPDPTTGARSTPIYQTAAYVFDDVDHAASHFNLHNFGYIYSRLTNPTVAVLEERVASLEGGRAALAAASGHAAQFLIFFTLMQPGDEFVASKNLYGGSLTQFGLSFPKLGWKCHFADPADPENFRPALQSHLRRKPGQSRRHRRRPRTGGANRPRGRHPADRRQHPGDPLSVPAVRVGRRPDLPFDDQVPRRARRRARRHRCRVRPLRLEPGQPLPRPDRARVGLSRAQILREFRRFRLHHQGAGGGAQGFRPDPVADERVPYHHRHRNPARAHGAALRECAEGGGIPRRPSQGRVGFLCRAGGQPVSAAGEEIPAQGRRRGVHLRGQGRLRRRRQAGRERAAVFAPRQYRRYQEPDPPPGLDHPPPAYRRTARGGRRRPGRRAPVDRP